MSEPSRHPADRLIQSVQFNCDVSDARYARDATMCVYLLRMREFYRWHHDIALGVRLSLDDVGDWLTEVEERWDSVEEMPYQPVMVGSREFDAFDCESINAALGHAKLPYSYSAGLGRRGKPHFVLAETVIEQRVDDLTVTVCGREFARDLVAQPAMSRDRSIWIRQDGVRRFLWELYEDWSFRRVDGPVARLAERYGLADGDTFETALNDAAESVQAVLIAHERGEVEAEALLPGGWKAMMASSCGAANEIYARAVRDSLADTLGTWPAIVESDDPGLLDFWLAGVDGARKQLIESSPIAPLMQAKDCASRMQIMRDSASSCRNRWVDIAHRMVSDHAANGEDSDFARIATEA